MRGITDCHVLTEDQEGHSVIAIAIESKLWRSGVLFIKQSVLFLQLTDYWV
jgi:hypothetical protein